MCVNTTLGGVEQQTIIGQRLARTVGSLMERAPSGPIISHLLQEAIMDLGSRLAQAESEPFIQVGLKINRANLGKHSIPGQEGRIITNDHLIHLALDRRV